MRTGSEAGASSELQDAEHRAWRAPEERQSDCLPSVRVGAERAPALRDPQGTGSGAGLVVWLPGPGGRLGDASQALRRLKKPNPPLAVGSNKFRFPARGTAAEGLCAGPGTPATQRLRGHLWRAPLGGTGAARGRGPGLGSGRRGALNAEPAGRSRSAIRPPVRGPGSLLPHLVPGEGGCQEGWWPE